MPPAARLTDMHTCPMVTGPVPHVGGPILPPCCPTVLIGGLPAARVGDMATCVGPPDVIAMGAFTTLIGGQPAARIGDMTAHGGVIVLGCFTVIIGDVGGGGAGSSFSGSMSAAKESASAFTGATATTDSSRSSATPSDKPSDAERTLAAQPGTSPAHRAAREKVVRDFYQDRPGLGADRANQDLKGIDLDKPVKVVSFPPPDTMTQNVRAKTKRPGAFFDPVGGQSPESLGISGSGRVPVVFKTPPGEGLQSTVAPIVDNWTDSANPLFCKGGGTQLTVDSNTLGKFTALPAAGGA